jgi:acetyl-CoA acetyltransferase
MRSTSPFRSDVYVVGGGLHRYQRPTETSYVELGLTAIRRALRDADVQWKDVDAVYTGTTRLGMGVSEPMLKHLGRTGVPTVQIENASASSSSAFALAVRDIASGDRDLVLAMGVDKAQAGIYAEDRTGALRTDPGAFGPVAQFAIPADEYQRRYDLQPADIARVAVKNHKNGSLNPNAHRQTSRTLEEVLSDRPIAGSTTRLQCCPVGEGASAVLVASERALTELSLSRARSVRVLSSQQRTDVELSALSPEAANTRITVGAALEQAGIRAGELDIVELHDAFAIEELLYAEAIGLCADGEAAALVRDGAFDIGGACAVNPSGGLLAMGHPIGPTGVGQVVEITRQLRGEAGGRQHQGARYGLAQMVGVGGVCVAHVLGAPTP